MGWSNCVSSRNSFNKLFFNVRMLIKARFHSNSKGFNENKLNENQKKIMGKGLPKRKPIPGVDNIVLVCSCKGGVGKSTTAVNLAVSLASSPNKLRVGLLDADVFGPSVPLMMNVYEQPLLNKDKLMLPLINYNVKCMSMGFLVGEDSAMVWRGLMVMSALEKLTRQVDWGHLDCLIVDTPPGTGDTLLSLIQNLQIAGVVVVSTPQKAALSVTARGLSMLSKLQVPVIGLVHNMSSAVCPNCSHTFSLYSEKSPAMELQLDVPLLCSIPIDSKIADCADSGTPISAIDPNNAQSKLYMKLANDIVAFLQEKRKPS